MGMTDRQFDAYQAKILRILKKISEKSPDNEELKDFINEIEAELKRP